ncbi:hypothetical protein [Fulvivirga lutea]|uniref:DUF4421 domain-containing protein n=1 Tax=Fulvivirga lutea TaxID=2810512 RepID=A0A975A012_9BACT|nr:hypothetical protein [Fulvivirga lutea]QSE95982.1 hypothetical protein JR347_10160 [Fulvivirga lutea]
MKYQHYFLIICLFCFSNALAQSRADKNPVTYEELYDEPYAINKLFVQFQPLYGELFVTNVNAGFGLEVSYYMADKMDFRVHARKTYTQKFDLTRDIADKNSNVDNQPNVFNYFELGATYHVKDFDESSSTKMFLYRKSYKGDKWAARVPLNVEIPCKVRKIYGARLGGLYFDTAVDIGRALEAQDLTTDVLVAEDGAVLPSTITDENGLEQDISVFSNMAVGGVYVGGSMTWIKNVAVDFDNKYQEGVDDLIFTAFLDIIVAPALSVDDIIYNGVTYSSEELETSIIGFRLGMDGKFNRTLSWGYGGEVGMRPGLKGRGFYALVKISFPIYSTNLDYKVEAFGK